MATIAILIQPSALLYAEESHTGCRYVMFTEPLPFEIGSLAAYKSNGRENSFSIFLRKQGPERHGTGRAMRYLFFGIS